jgi:hypothetical protein
LEEVEDTTNSKFSWNPDAWLYLAEAYLQLDRENRPHNTMESIVKARNEFLDNLKTLTAGKFLSGNCKHADFALKLTTFAKMIEEAADQIEAQNPVQITCNLKKMLGISEKMLQTMAENGTGFNRAVWKDNFLGVIKSIAEDELRPAHSRQTNPDVDITKRHLKKMKTNHGLANDATKARVQVNQ